MAMTFGLIDFVRESNRIEGIHREPTAAEIEAHAALLAAPALTVGMICDFVRVCAGPQHILRDKPGLNVRVGTYIAPPGGPDIRAALERLLAHVNEHPGPEGAWRAHVGYETFHPFTDGNGRSGRAIWLWQMGGSAPLGFLHSFYYATLENSEGRAR